MSRRVVLPAGALGAIAGAVAGAPYLSNAGGCAPPGTPELSCSLSSAFLPFLAAIAIGCVAGIALARLGGMAIRRLAGPSSARRPAPAAAEVTDPSLRIATWGRSPQAGRGDAGASVERERPPEPPRDRDFSLGSRGRPKPTPRLPG